MNVTLSIDEQTIEKARKIAKSMNKSLNQLIREYLEQLTTESDVQKDIDELRKLTAQGQGRSQGWHFDREEIHERTPLS